MKLFEYNDYKLIEKNALRPRSFFLPYSNIENAKEEKPDIINLNGKWSFSYYQSILDVEDDLNILYNKQIEVPSCWQYQGFEKPFYVNNDYQFPFNPPYLPISTPVGVYHKSFNLDLKKDYNYILTILGASASTIFINGINVGYFEGTHNMHEFDITKYIHQGDNDIVLIMYKWCNGSYLESQDMYRDNGIFRDIYISLNPKTYVFDYCINTKKISNKKYCLTLTDFLINNSDNVIQTLYIYDKNDSLIIKKDFQNHVEVSMDVNEWNAETPYLYKYYLTLKKEDTIFECIKGQIGFKTIDIDKGVFKINNVPIKIKGINYHESTPENGFYVPKDVFLKDIKIIKSLNCNTIRFSHYPSNPYMLSLCEEYGLYVINEADIETYGCLATSNKNYVSENEIFEERFIDRVKHLYERDKNSCAIIMWSIANESGVGKNLDKAYEYLKNVSDIPIQYETCFRCEYDDCFKGKNKRGYDIVSIMYPSLETLKYYNEQDDIRPFYMCEYMHSMGLGPGELEEVWDYIYKTPRLIGGCIWEYCDHANILEDNTSNTKRKYLYGGDNEEYIHDSNFCLDGVVLPDRRLSTSAKVIKNIYRPFIFRKEKNEIIIKNTNSFLSSTNYDFLLVVYENGSLLSKGKIECDVLPFEEKTFIKINCNPEKEYSYVIETYCNRNLVGIDNFILGKYKIPFSESKALLSNYQVNGNNYEAFFDERTRTITSLKVNNKEIFCQNPINCGYGCFDKNKKGFIPNIFHAPTDNDRYVKDEWLEKMFDKMWISFYETTDSDNAFIQKGIYGPAKYETMFDIMSSYYFYKDYIKIDFKIKARYDIKAIPKFGVRLQINKEFENISYYGLGPNENYPDFHSGCYLSLFSNKAYELNEDYIKPQENGNRMCNRFIRLTDNDGDGFEIDTIENNISFSIHNYSLEDLTKAKHSFEIMRRNFYELTLDGYVRGIGSQSCGPSLSEKYEISLKKGEELAFCFCIKPIKKQYENN